MIVVHVMLIVLMYAVIAIGAAVMIGDVRQEIEDYRYAARRK